MCEACGRKRTGLILLCCLQLAFCAYLSSDLETHREKLSTLVSSSSNYSSMLAACLNGRPLYDSLSGHALFTQRAISVDVTPIQPKGVSSGRAMR